MKSWSQRTAGAVLAAVLGLGCGGTHFDAGDLGGPWRLQMQHDGDSCNTPHPQSEVFDVTLRQAGASLELPGPIRLQNLYGLQIAGLSGSMDESFVDWAGTASVTTAEGCGLAASLTATGIARSNGQRVFQISGLLDLSIEKTPATCLVEKYCKDARYVYTLYR